MRLDDSGKPIRRRLFATTVEHGLFDPRAEAERLIRLVPRRLPSGRPSLTFELP